MNKQLWKVKTKVPADPGPVTATWASRTSWIVAADFAELQSVLVEDDVLSTKKIHDVEVVEDEGPSVEDIVAYLVRANCPGAAGAVRHKFGARGEYEASKT